MCAEGRTRHLGPLVCEQPQTWPCGRNLRADGWRLWPGRQLEGICSLVAAPGLFWVSSRLCQRACFQPLLFGAECFCCSKDRGYWCAQFGAGNYQGAASRGSIHSLAPPGDIGWEKGACVSDEAGWRKAKKGSFAWLYSLLFHCRMGKIVITYLTFLTTRGSHCRLLLSCLVVESPTLPFSVAWRAGLWPRGFVWKPGHKYLQFSPSRAEALFFFFPFPCSISYLIHLKG